MKKSDVVKLACCAALALPLATNAATYRYWRAADRVWDGDWSDTAHWKDATLPGSGEIACFDFNTNATVNIDVDWTFGHWHLSGAPLDAEPAWIVWIGTHKLNGNNSTGPTLGKNRRLCIDGPEVVVKKSMEMGTNSILKLKSGSFAVNSSSVTMHSGSKIRIEGGSAKFAVGTVGQDAKVELAGGIWHWTGDSKTGLLDWTSGTLRITGRQMKNNGTNACAEYMPPRGCVLDTRDDDSVNAFYCYTGASTNRIDGTLYVTNRTNATYPYPRYYNEKVDHVIEGVGTLYVDRFAIRNGYSTTFKVPRVYLGVGFCAEQSGGAYYKFPEGMSFGSWGNWSNIADPAICGTDECAGYVPYIQMAKDVSFDTLDCFDKTTTHTIKLVKCRDNGITSLKATGGGTVDLVFNDPLDTLRRLEIGANTTLYLTNSLITVERLVMGPGARLYAKIGSKIEMKEVPGDGAKLLMVGTPTPQTLNPILSAYGLQDSIPQDFIDFPEGLGQEWYMKSEFLYGIYYLSDGYDPGATIHIKDADKGTYYAEWTGEVDDKWNNKNNWSTTNVPSGTTYCFVGRDLQPNINYDVTSGSIRYIVFMSNCGPYFINGFPIDFKYGGTKETQNSLRSFSQFPVIFNNTTTFSVGKAYLRNAGTSYIRLSQGLGSISNLWVTGDCRIGGESTCGVIKYLNVDGVENSLQVLPGGYLTASSEEAATQNVADMKRMVVDGTFRERLPVSGLTYANWYGNGTIRLNSLAGSGETFTLQDGITLIPENGWDTESAIIAVTGNPTLGAEADWVYGTAAATPAMTADERALVIAARSSLCVSNDEATITFADPIAGEGDLVKKGSGTMVLATDDSAIGGAFKLAAGSLGLSEELRSGLSSTEWTRVFTAGSFTGVTSAAFGEGVECRVVDAGPGLKKLEVRQARTRLGTVIIMR